MSIPQIEESVHKKSGQLATIGYDSIVTRSERSPVERIAPPEDLAQRFVLRGLSAGTVRIR
jgi:hypothetical protein